VSLVPIRDTSGCEETALRGATLSECTGDIGHDLFFTCATPLLGHLIPKDEPMAVGGFPEESEHECQASQNFADATCRMMPSPG